jgi:hypothetical protein
MKCCSNRPVLSMMPVPLASTPLGHSDQAGQVDFGEDIFL